MAEKQNTQNRVGSKFERRKLSPSSSSSILLRCVTKFERLLSPPPRPRTPIQEKTQNRVGSLVGLSRQTRTVSPFWPWFVENPPPPWPIFNNTAPKLVINHLQALKSSEESLREQLEEAKKKEAAFIVTLAKREQEIAELKSAVRDLKAQLKPAAMQARRLLLDPAIHEEFPRLKNLVEEKDKRVKELQDNIAAVNFTSQSKMGKMPVAKCRTLQEENEEVGNQASVDKMHELAKKFSLQKYQNAEPISQFEGKIFSLQSYKLEEVGNQASVDKMHEVAKKFSLQKYQNAEPISQFEGLQKNMDGLTNDVERSNEMVMLQAKLDEKEQEIQRLKQENFMANVRRMDQILRGGKGRENWV